MKQKHPVLLDTCHSYMLIHLEWISLLRLWLLIENTPLSLKETTGCSSDSLRIVMTGHRTTDGPLGRLIPCYLIPKTKLSTG